MSILIELVYYSLSTTHTIYIGQPEIQYVPQVHEEDITYTVPSRQSLIKPIIGGGAPVQPLLAPQPQFVYVQAQPTAPSEQQKTLYQQQQEDHQQRYMSIYSQSP